MKDLRSWAIVNTALELGVRDLALWTAGNAGYSLAKLVSLVNQQQPQDLKIRVHALVEQDADFRIRYELNRWGAEVVEVRAAHLTSPYVLTEGEVWQRIEYATDKPIPHSTRWHVTDGWDGVGVLMYYLLALQVVDPMQSGAPAFDHVVIPVGSGDLFLGFILAIRDTFSEADLPTIWAAVPSGNNVFTPPKGRDPQAKCYAGKLSGAYTPLQRILEEKKVMFETLNVNEDDHLNGVQAIAASRKMPFGAEPSALLAFGSLFQLRRKLEDVDAIRGNDRKNKVLVVNTGSGIFPSPEQDWLQALHAN